MDLTGPDNTAVFKIFRRIGSIQLIFERKSMQSNRSPIKLACAGLLAASLAGPVLAQNPCAPKKGSSSSAKGNPCAAKGNPCAAKSKSNPCAAKKK